MSQPVLSQAKKASMSNKLMRASVSKYGAVLAEENRVLSLNIGEIIVCLLKTQLNQEAAC
jgi:hypothetical protein